jgi:hypothetical protein
VHLIFSNGLLTFLPCFKIGNMFIKLVNSLLRVRRFKIHTYIDFTLALDKAVFYLDLDALIQISRVAF